MLASASAAAPPALLPGANATSVAYRWAFVDLAVEVRYSLVSKSCAFVEKQLAIVPLREGDAALSFNVTGVTLFASTSITSGGVPPKSGE